MSIIYYDSFSYFLCLSKDSICIKSCIQELRVLWENLEEGTDEWMRVSTAHVRKHVPLVEESDVEMESDLELEGEGDNDGESDDEEI
jgi:hypothetical protein